MQIDMIMAVAENGLIGSNGNIPWHIPSELRRFQAITEDNWLLVGNNTYKTLPALKNRKFMVIGTNIKPTKANPNILTAPSPLSGISILGAQGISYIMVIGGKSIYEQLLPLTKRLYVSHIKGSNFKGDVYLDQSFMQILKDSPYRELIACDDFVQREYLNMLSYNWSTDPISTFRNQMNRLRINSEKIDQAKLPKFDRSCCNTLSTYLDAYELGVIEGEIFANEIMHDRDYPKMPRHLFDLPRSYELDETTSIYHENLLTAVAVHTALALNCSCQRGNFAVNAGRDLGFQRGGIKGTLQYLKKVQIKRK